MSMARRAAQTSVILTPLDLSAPVQVGPRRYRKQLLRKVGIDYPGLDGETQRVEFDDAYLHDLADSFNAGAYDLAPFVLADEKNRHTLAPERYRGELLGVEVTPDGLDGILELSEDAAELVERTKRRLGVSVRIKSGVQHVDGRRIKRAIHHVLGTLDPRMQGPNHSLSPWQPIDLASNDPTETVLDLSGARYQEDIMPDLSLDHLEDDQLETLRSLAAANGIDLSTPAEDEPGDEDADATEDGDESTDDGDAEGADDESLLEGAGITDAELDALIDAELDSMGVDREVSLSAEDDDESLLDDEGLEDVLARRDADVDLANADSDFAADEAAGLRAELARRDYLRAGVPPYVLDLAAPVLALASDDDTLDLASPLDGSTVQVRTIVTQLLDAMKGTIDLAREDGYGHEDADSGDVSPEAQAWLAHLGAEGLT